MEPKNFAIYNLTTGLVENVVYVAEDVLAGLPDLPPEGYGAVAIPEDKPYGIGWSYIDGQFISPFPPEPVTP